MTKWWETFPQTMICYHPLDDRYRPCAQVEKCAWCESTRFVSERPWHPTVLQK